MELKQKSIYWCKTIDDAKSFAEKCDELGWAWSDGKKISEQLMYDMYGENTCYKTNCGIITFGHKDYYTEKGRKIKEFKSENTKIGDNAKFYYAQNKLSFCALLYKLSAEGCFAYLEKYDTKIPVKDITYTWEYQKENTIVIRLESGRILFTTQQYKNTHFPKFNVIVAEPYNSDYILAGNIAEYNGQKCAIENVDETTLTAYVRFKNGEINKVDIFSLKKCEFSPITEIKRGNYIIASNGEIIKASEVYTYYVRSGSRVLLAEDIDINRTQRAASFRSSAIATGKVIKRKSSATEYIIREHTSIAYMVQDVNGNEFFIPYDEEIEVQQEKEKYQKEYSTVISGEHLKRLIQSAVDVLKSHGYKDSNEEAVGKFIEQWNVNKSWIANVLRKHPNWDEENLCVTSIEKDSRQNDRDAKSCAISSFMGFVSDSSYFNQEIKPKYLLLKELFNNREFINCVVEEKITPAFSEYFKRVIADNKTLEQEIKVSCNINAKPTRVIMAFCKAVGLNLIGGFEARFAKLSDAISSASSNKRFVLSINPIDFLLMSNGNSWSSCHYLDAGNSNKCYQAGTMSYALDSTSLIFYSIGSKSQSPFALVKKERRQIFCYSGYAILQSRLYPSYSDSEFYPKSRQYVTDIINTCEGYSEGWVINSNAYKDHRFYFNTHYNATHYPDYTYRDYSPTMSIKTKYLNKFIDKSTIGNYTICPVCGSAHKEHHDCRCTDCYPR